MICKKCGTNIADTSKFCGYCGEKVEVPKEESNTNTNLIVEEELNDVKVNEVIQPLPIDNLTINTLENETNTSNNEQNNSNKKNGNFSRGWALILLGGVLLVIAIVLLLVAFNKPSYNESINAINSAINNLEDNSSGTVQANLLMQSTDNISMNMSGTFKYAKVNDGYGFEISIDKSMLFDEFNIYFLIDKDYLKLYVKSNVIDMLGSTSSSLDTWLKYEMPMDDNIVLDEELIQYDLSSIFDKKHIKYVGKEGNLKHYQLIIDNNLIEKVEALNSDTNEFARSNNITITDNVVLDVYLTNNKLAKITLDLSNLLDEESLSKIIFSMDFKDFNSTNISIPKEAINSFITLDEYMEEYKVNDVESDYEIDYDTNYDFDIDIFE